VADLRARAYLYEAQLIVVNRAPAPPAQATQPTQPRPAVQARALIQQALGIAERKGLQNLLIRGHLTLGELAVCQLGTAEGPGATSAGKLYVEAVAEFQEAIDLASHARMQWDQASVLLKRAALFHGRDAVRELADLQAARNLYVELGDEPTVAAIDKTIAGLQEGR
jgi:hypothetical protein